jgi:hypothetical protein
MTPNLEEDPISALAALPTEPETTGAPPELTLHTTSPKTQDPLTGRCNLIENILNRWDELTSPLHGRTGQGTDDLPAQMPASYNPSVKELERLIRVLRDDRHAHLMLTHSGEKVSLRQQWWHLNEYYLKAHRVLTIPPKIPRSKRGDLQKLQLTDDGRRIPILRTTRHPDARADLAHMAVRTIATYWALPHEPQLPIDNETERERKRRKPAA